jgi:hypothetical protein
MNPNRSRLIPTIVLAAALATTAACADTKEPAMPPPTSAPRTVDPDGPVIALTHQQPRPIGDGLTLIYTGPEGADARFLVPQLPAEGFGLNLGDQHTIAGYQVRLVAVYPNSVHLAVTDPAGQRLGTTPTS